MNNWEYSDTLETETGIYFKFTFNRPIFVRAPMSWIHLYMSMDCYLPSKMVNPPKESMGNRSRIGKCSMLQVYISSTHSNCFGQCNQYLLLSHYWQFRGEPVLRNPEHPHINKNPIKKLIAIKGAIRFLLIIIIYYL